MDWKAGYDLIKTLTEDDLTDYPYTQESLTDNLKELQGIVESDEYYEDVSVMAWKGKL